jgi:mannose-6-phosphate isomerase-like protein (cupin superfamily)
MAHHTIDEIWCFLAGRGRMWRQPGSDVDETANWLGTSLAILVGMHFEFRSDSSEPLIAIGVTMPPWLGDGEAPVVEGPWQATV